MGRVLLAAARRAAASGLDAGVNTVLTLEQDLKRTAHAAGKTAGMAAGMAAGKTAGMAAGKTAGKIEIFSKLARIKFGELPPARLAQAARAGDRELDRWLEALLRVDRLDDVFGDASPD